MVIIDLILLWIVNFFVDKQSAQQTKKRPTRGSTRANKKNEDLAGFYFGTYPLGESQHKEDRQEPVNQDYDEGPDW